MFSFVVNSDLLFQTAKQSFFQLLRIKLLTFIVENLTITLSWQSNLPLIYFLDIDSQERVV